MPNPTPDPAPSATEAITIESALSSAGRLLHAAEMETNLALMERLEKLADSWVSIASLLVQRDR